ncbi:MAG: cbb3-type cytochrome c oxidase subunit II [Bryobacteraceae bacterium]
MSQPEKSGRVLRMSYVVACVAGVIFFQLSVILLGVWPGRVLDDQTRRMSPESPLQLTASEERGRAVYSREGCAYCHTQQVRYTRADMERFGAPTLAWETRYDFPHLWGTRRIGPDLAREGATHSLDWHFTHLFAPRTVAADSVMPAYPWLFAGSADHPTQEARDLVSYLESLGRARELAGPEGESHARQSCQCIDDDMAMMAFHAKALNASPSRTRRQGKGPRLMVYTDLAPGREIYDRNCASCHGKNGDGTGPGAVSLRPHPANFTEHEYTLEHLSRTLTNGIGGTAMQAWRDLSLEDQSAVAAVVRSFRAGQAEPQLPANIVELGRKTYQANCSQCHGEMGGGDGTAVSELPANPADFRSMRPSIAQSLRVLRNGIEGSKMAPWTGRLSEAELSAVAYYVRSFYEGDGGAK